MAAKKKPTSAPKPKKRQTAGGYGKNPAKRPSKWHA